MDAQEKYRRQYGHVAPAYGYLRKDRHQRVFAFHSMDEAQSWYTSLSSAPGAYNYAALYAAGNLVAPIAESFGGPTTISGAWPWHEIVGAMPWHEIIGHEIIGAAIDTLRRQARAAAEGAIAQGVRGRFFGVLHDAHAWRELKAFTSEAAAEDWFERVTGDPASFTYAAYFDKEGPFAPTLVNESAGGGAYSPVAGLAA